jgi:hypothetical protein
VRKMLTLAAILAVCAAPAFAADAAKPSAQGEKMKACAQEYHAKNLAKSQYRTFMSTCLKKDYQVGSFQAASPAPAPVAAPVAVKSAEPAAPAATPANISQRDKMKKCNADAKSQSLKGAPRKEFMASCLSH